MKPAVLSRNEPSAFIDCILVLEYAIDSMCFQKRVS